MTILTDGEDTWARELLGRAMSAFGTAQEVLLRTVDRLKAEEKVSGTDLTKDIRDMNNALTLALSLEGKTRDASGERRAGAASLDLDAARLEIGCRLDCLRAARGDGGFSGGADG